MTNTELLNRADVLRHGRTPFVLATVVHVERPTSARPGDSALVLPDGTVEGFVGGTCAETTVQLQGLRVLETGESLLLRITPAADTGGEGARDPVEGLVTVANPCLSGGTLDIFLEANLPRRWPTSTVTPPSPAPCSTSVVCSASTPGKPRPGSRCRPIWTSSSSPPTAATRRRY